MKRLLIFAAALLLAACGGSGKESVDSGGAIDIPADDSTVADLLLDQAVPGDNADEGIFPDVPVLPDEYRITETFGETPAIDVHPEEKTPEVQPTDVEPDYKPQEAAAFRIDGISMTEPIFCFMMGETCLPVLDMVNQSLSEAVADGSVNVVGLFTPFGPGENTGLMMGQALCNLDNPLDESLPEGHCTFDEESMPAEYDDVVISTEGMCGADEAQMEPPCFASGEGDMALEFYGVVLGLSNVTISGHVQGWPPDGIVNPGFIRGYLPEEIAKTVEISIPGTPPIIVTIYELLKNSETQPEVIDGHNAWPVTIEFTASQVEMAD
jgi:hypothetical protein